MMGKQHYLLRAALTAIVASASTVVAQAPDTGRKIDPDAMAALSKMGTYLRSLSAIQVKANITTEDVTDDGQKIQSLSSVDMIAKRPDRMRVEVVNASKPRTFYYDGKNFTLWAPRTKYYATVPAPGTINELVDKLEDKYNIQFPLVDLFRWGVDKSDSTDITNATYVGPSAVNGITANQYAFRQPGADWQVWIQTGDYPLPLRAVITTTTDDARPQHETVYTWNLAPSFNEKAFAFTIPADAKKITLADVNKMRTVAKKNGGGGKQ